MDTLEFWIKQNRLDASKLITVKHLYDAKCIKSAKHGVYLSGAVRNKTKIHQNYNIGDETKEGMESVMRGVFFFFFYSTHPLSSFLSI